MERIYAFLPSVLAIACIAGVTLLYVIWTIKRFGKNFKSVEWHQKNKWKVAWTVGTPLSNIWAPAAEELVFRAPLIIAFSVMSSAAWYGVFASSVLFALVHWPGKKIWVPEILAARKVGDHETDDIEAEINRLHQKAGKRILVQKVFQMTLALFLGILAGYYGIKYQSIWVSFGIHAAWNLIVPLAFPLLLVLGLWAFSVLLDLRDRVRGRRRELWGFEE